MQLADRTSAASVAGPTRLPAGIDAAVSGWGGRDRVRVRVVRAGDIEQLRAAVVAPRLGGAIARGMGRSYGDAAQRAGGLVLDTTLLRGFELDRAGGLLRAEAGATLGALLTALAGTGWVLPVVPGTQHVTVGGAVASDIHGKNHAVAGTFGTHVLALGLLTASGDVVELTRGQNADLLAATIGGMGLTGVILWAAIQLRRLPSSWLAVDIDRVRGLDDALAILDSPGGRHRVAWLDLLGGDLVRGVVTRADHVEAAELGPDNAPAGTTVKARLRIPPRWPGGLLRTGVVRAHNEYRFRCAPRRATGRLEAFGDHMFPLDALDAWPRLYGPEGLVQYQLVVPTGRERALEQVILALRGSAVPCYLAVLKDFGPANDAPMSFPMRGWTLALDVPGAAPGLAALLNRFDQLVAEAGGRVYLAKDGRLRADALAAMYPRLAHWRAVRDRVDPHGRWLSDLGLRTGMVATPR
jgi:decaprenylphospho-beta-D-ribofuranose 2-oxidase